ncbi:hypothetical protein D3C85_733730 [compost metagenome]
MPTLTDINVAILAVDGFEQVELTGPRQSLQDEGARTVLISARTDPILGMHHDKPGDRFPVDLTFLQAASEPEVFDALLLPGCCCRAAWSMPTRSACIPRRRILSARCSTPVSRWLSYATARGC